MSQPARFRYALEPILLTRQWDLDALLVELSERNSAIAKQEIVIAVLQTRIGAAGVDWHALADGVQTLSVQRFAMLSRFIFDLSRQLKEQEESMAALVEARDGTIDHAVQARRALEAVEKHRAEMKTRFAQMRISGDFKIADDQWNTLQSGTASHGSEY